MGKYKKMIEQAKNGGLTNEDKMWKSISAIEDFLEEIGDDALSERFLRRQHEIMYGKHYDECTAYADTEHMVYTDRDGVKRVGPHWSPDEVESAMRNLTFNVHTTKWDKFVAANAFYADTCKVLNDDQIIKAAHSFFFADEDWVNKESKVWDYFTAREMFESSSI